MNSLNALGNRQVASLNADLTKMESGEAGPSIQGKYRSKPKLKLKLMTTCRADNDHPRSSEPVDR